jgi:hypothetical protein
MLSVPSHFWNLSPDSEVTPTVQAQRAAIQLTRMHLADGVPGLPTKVIAATVDTDLVVASPSSNPIGLTEAEAAEGASMATARARLRVRFMM